jgi:alpha-1,3-rhamnosyltransferase
MEDGNSIPLVTAVLVCWNHAKFVRKAVESVFAQTYPNIELFVFDNGSTDGSREELQRLRSEREFNLFFQDNIGLVPALNLGLEKSNGKYLACLSTDDVWLPDKTAVQVSYLEENPDVHLVAGQIESIDADGNAGPFPTIRRPGEPTFAQLMTEGNLVPGPTIMCRIATLKALGGYDPTLKIEDYPLVLKLTRRGMRVVVLPQSLTLYRFHGSNWTAGSLEKELLEVGAQYRDLPEYRGFYARHFPLSFWRLVLDGRKRDAIRLLFSEPVPLTWRNFGKGALRMLIPYSLVLLVRSLRQKLKKHAVVR